MNFEMMWLIGLESVRTHKMYQNNFINISIEIEWSRAV